jgi:spore maturation protein CgeB
MRTYEAAASGACMLVERTPEHEEIFGKDGEAVCFFRDIPDMLAQCKRLVVDEPLRRRLAEAAFRRITEGHNTYRDRLATMLGAWNGHRDVRGLGGFPSTINLKA